MADRTITTTCANRPYAKKATCAKCGKPFAMDPGGWKKTRVVVEETRVSCFRGDDEVRFFHPECY